jgi:hypothetical protein
VVVDVLLLARIAFAMGWTFNTDSPDATTTGPTIAAVGIALTTLSLIVICLRMYVRGWVVKAIGVGECLPFLQIETKYLTGWVRRLAHVLHLGEFLFECIESFLSDFAGSSCRWDSW